MTWAPPSQTQPTLILPQLITHDDALDSLVPAQANLSVSVSENFIQTWENGPHAETPSDVEASLRILMEGFCELARQGRGMTEISSKESPDDLVTEVDGGIEVLFRYWLRQHLPHHKVIGEEGPKPTISREDYIWYVDPIDGTSNFVDGNDRVVIQFACIYQGKPWVAIAALPFLGKVISGSSRGTLTGIDIPPVESLPEVVGTEYMQSRLDEGEIFSSIQKNLSITPLRLRSIGLNVLTILLGESSYFYKQKVLGWDAIPPLALLWFAYPEGYQLELFPMRLDRTFDPSPVSPFTLTDDLLTKMNTLNKYRLGLILCYPISRPQFRDVVLKEFF